MSNILYNINFSVVYEFYVYYKNILLLKMTENNNIHNICRYLSPVPGDMKSIRRRGREVKNYIIIKKVSTTQYAMSVLLF